MNLGRPHKMLGKMANRLRSAVGHSAFKRFIVLSRSRTGSNMLVSFLNSHPGVIAEGEILAHLKGQDYREVLARAYGRQPYFVKAKGFKVFYYHPLDGDPDALFEDLSASPEIAVIHLKRRNVLRTLVSRKIAGSQNVWAVRSADGVANTTRKTTEISGEELEAGFRRTKEWETRADLMFKEHPLISVYYEDLLQDPSRQFLAIQNFLGLPPVALQTELRKQNPERLSDLLANYADLKRAFAGSEWLAFFDE